MIKRRKMASMRCFPARVERSYRQLEPMLTDPEALAAWRRACWNKRPSALTNLLNSLALR
ncbi:hypothetical protein D3C86_2194560 [compost metagenome]